MQSWNLLHMLDLTKLHVSHCYVCRRDCWRLKRHLLFPAAYFENSESAFALMSEDNFNGEYGAVRVIVLRVMPVICVAALLKNKSTEGKLFSSR
jgi:hypothetical protein